jgi:ribonuclease Z
LAASVDPTDARCAKLMGRRSDRLHGWWTLICEGQYRHSDLERARKNLHMTTVQSATLARRAQAGELVLFHSPDRYRSG